MTDANEEGCPVCNSSDNAKAEFTTAKVAEHIKEKARRDETHQNWIDEHATNGTLGEIREALTKQAGPRP